ncbi:hypothetical protein DH2020_013313 [Rehmannia glutinosa]|uniref:STAS domain-containing protein n=1 Tax=Rehmannia glutinosa TaxID=99300 RepID=A0ABR0X521_REHGL
MVINSNRVENSACHDEPTTSVARSANATPMPPLEVHKVCLPPPRTTVEKLRHRLSEIFFPDDPLHRFQDQKPLKKLILGLEYFFPLFQWGPDYSFKLLKSDFISGVTIASLAIPQGISYAKLANLPPIIGLYSSFVPPLIYSVLGSSRHLAVGPVSIASLVMGTMLSETVSYTNEPTLYLKLAFTATFFAGVFQASLGFLRLGFIIDFLSKATLIGFMAGAAVIVALQQLKGLLGISHFTGKMQLIPVLSSVFHHENESQRKPKLFWISAAAPLTSVILSTVLMVCLKSKLHGIKTEGIAVGRTFAALRNYQVDGNKEMVAIGLMNMAGSCSSCYVTTGSFSRSAVNYNAGAQTVVSNVIMAAAVLVTLLFLMPLFHYTPNLILAAIIITAVIGLIDYEAAYKLWKVDKLDFMACLCSFLGVLFISVPLGLAIAVGISVFKILLHVTRPNTVALGNIPGTQIYQNLSRYTDAARVPSFLILAVEAPIYFANSTYLQERILRWVREEEEWLASNKRSDIKCVILDMTAVTAIDTSGLDAISEIRKMLEKRSLKLVLANPVGSVMEKLHQSNILETFGLEGLYLTVGEAVADISSSWKAQP